LPGETEEGHKFPQSEWMIISPKIWTVYLSNTLLQDYR
jgi:hypothetical protein